ncbi:hypothetical protein CUMW_219040 [Citrus unshiu]|nr:hypothetical protein CUMW_219040 [Citrus unshiu]
MSSLMALSIHWRTWKQKILGAEDLTINFQALEVTPFSPKRVNKDGAGERKDVISKLPDTKPEYPRHALKLIDGVQNIKFLTMSNDTLKLRTAIYA